MLGVVMLEDGRYAESAALLQSVVELRNENLATADSIDIYASLVAAYRGAGDDGAARDLCENVRSRLDLSENAHQRVVAQFEQSCAEG